MLKSNTFHAIKFKIGCGVQVKQLGGVSCFSPSLPSTELDGYVELGATGPPSFGERGDSPWRPAGKMRELKPGQKWRRAGVTCELNTDGGRAVQCRNGTGDGFFLEPRIHGIVSEG